MPDFILAISDRGAMVGHLVARELRRQIPIITVGYLDEPNDHFVVPGFAALTGTKTTAFLPEAVQNLHDRKVLLVDDFVMSGDGLRNVTTQLLKYGFEADRIRTGAVVATRLAIANRKGPNFFAREARDFDFYFPWGRAR
jgi:hypoxanthine phosphoribosyltransferase